MKKSRIIVPALAMLTLSVAASVTGTVAWFTASRTANATLNNLVAISTSGALSMELTNVNAESVNSTDKTVKLRALRDFSYDVSHHKGYIASFNIDGTTVTETKEVTSYTGIFGSFGSPATDVYYVNSFNATFSTTSSAKSYLYFNNNHAKSGLNNDYSLDTHAGSIYRALRVSMEAIDSRGSGATTKIITWAPYTDLAENKVLNVVEAAKIKGDGVSASVAASTTNYVKESGDPIVGVTPNVVKKATEDPVTEGNARQYALDSALLLSSELMNGINVTVKFVIWFEGLDPVCLSTSKDVQVVTSAITAEAIRMGFYAIPETAFAA